MYRNFKACNCLYESNIHCPSTRKGTSGQQEIGIYLLRKQQAFKSSLYERPCNGYMRGRVETNIRNVTNEPFLNEIQDSNTVEDSFFNVTTV